MSAFNKKEACVSTHSITPLTCRYCGAIDHPGIGPGKGPHHAAAVCRHCGMHLHWLSRYPPAERQARRQAARAEAMSRKPPSRMQMSYLAALQYAGPPPVNMLAASNTIDRLTRNEVHL